MTEVCNHPPGFIESATSFVITWWPLKSTRSGMHIIYFWVSVHVPCNYLLGRKKCAEKSPC
jgi:hypothetical protein